MTVASPLSLADILEQLQRLKRQTKQRRHKAARVELSLLESLIAILKSQAVSGTLPAEKLGDALLSPEDAAELLGLSPGTLANWRSSGRESLSYLKCGRSVRYRASEIRRYLQRQQTEHTL